MTRNAPAFKAAAFMLLMGLLPFAFVIGCSPLAKAGGAAPLPAPQGWASFTDKALGATLYYPANWFGDEKLQDGAHNFASLLGNGAHLTFRAVLDSKRTGAAATVKQLQAGEAAATIIAVESGANYYEMRRALEGGMVEITRVLYSCKERVVNAVTLSFPQSQRADYEAMFKKMRRRFTVGLGARTPVASCN